MSDQILTSMRRGAVLASRYRLEEVAGAGGMATVWRATDQRLDRNVAVKVMSSMLASDPRARARFSREARAHAAILHPHLVRIFDYDASGTRPYLVLEYVPGQTLAHLLRERCLGTQELHKLANQLLSAVACIHDHGMLHRDIKPDNVLMDPERGVRLTDFGIAHVENGTHLTRTGDIIGTLSFMAPEVLDGDPPSKQSDLFAVGVVLRKAAASQALDATLTRLIVWLTKPGPGLRPADAHAALRMLQRTELRASYDGFRKPPAIEPTVRMSRPLDTEETAVIKHRRRSTLMTWLACAAAVLAVVLALLLTDGFSANGTAPSPHTVASTKTSARTPASLNARLSQLTRDIKQAAQPGD